MENYLELRERQQQEINTLPIRWAFSNDQFRQVLKDFELTEDNMNLLVRIPGGGFMLKTETYLLHEMYKRHDQERQQAIDADKTGDGFCFEMLEYELGNHEYIITGDLEPAMDALGLSLEDFKKSEKLQNAMRKAIKAQRDPVI